MSKDNKITLSMNTLLYGDKLFDDLTNLKDDEVIRLATVTFSSFNGGDDIATHVHMSPVNEILINQFTEEMKTLLHKLISLFDLSCYKESLINGKEYTVAKFFIGVNGETLEAGIEFEAFIQNSLFDEDFNDRGLRNEIAELLGKIETKCSRMFDRYAEINDEDDEQQVENSMLKPVQNIEDEKGLIFTIEGKVCNLYKGDSDLDEIKNAFINCPAIKGSEEISNYKHMGLTDGNIENPTNPLIVTYNNKFIIEESSLIGKCIFPIKIKELSNMISELADYYRNLDYEIIARR